MIMDTFLKLLKKKGKLLKAAEITIRLDNAGENTDMENILKESEWNVMFQFTAPDTPQQNGKVERKFATLKGRIRVMLNWTGVDEEMRRKLWSYTDYNATQHDMILTTRKNPINAYKIF